MNKMMAKHITGKPEETARVAENLARAILKKGIGSQAVVVGLSGELGAGKTTFTQAFAKALGVKEPVVSPTFILERVYRLPKQTPLSHFVHIDAYRLKGRSELFELGWDALIANPKNIIMVEWADKIGQVLPKDATQLFFSHKGGDKRNIEVKIQK
ncbi:MAG: tRNA (adenosine(37)-N6)-threonylcarbamoyltransferase complex ATPase subunit type 1 TsaE [Candidatus Lloydbacteria bacterium]|nr:tRNA (adenosine(37)-N6)-threonylcarbamoyltransferase complex ATPase subunit type 1 TsaE [Candidatus Lloydbacteria bacterium]